MAWDMHTEGLTEVSAVLERLGQEAQNVAVGSLFDGAGVVADAFKAAVNGIRTEPYDKTKKHRLPSPEEKAALVGKTGIAKFHKNGSEVDTLVGLTGDLGYVRFNHRKKAVIVIARSINSGTSFMTKQPVFRKAASSAKGAAEAAMVRKADQMFKDIIGE